jgi:hypothetical protein
VRGYQHYSHFEIYTFGREQSIKEIRGIDVACFVVPGPPDQSKLSKPQMALAPLVCPGHASGLYPNARTQREMLIQASPS